jgi:hypothetical protein
MTYSTDYSGLWVTPDNRIRHQLLPDGRYVEARGSEADAFGGRYAIRFNRIEYNDDRGFTADGYFDGDVLYRGAIVLVRQGAAQVGL